MQHCLAFTLISDVAIPCSEYPMTCAKAGAPVERMNIAVVSGVYTVVLSGSTSEKVIQIVMPTYGGYKWQCLTTH